MIASIYLYAHYTHAAKMAVWEGQAQEIDYQRLFEFGSYKIERTEKEIKEEEEKEELKDQDIPDDSSENKTETALSDSDSEISSYMRAADED